VIRDCQNLWLHTKGILRWLALLLLLWILLVLLLLLAAAAYTVVFSAPIGRNGCCCCCYQLASVHIAAFCLSLPLGLGFLLSAPWGPPPNDLGG